MAIGRKTTICILMFICTAFFTTGCWDGVELNDRSLEIAWGVDKLEKNKTEISAQIAIPSKLQSGTGSAKSETKAFHVVTGVGKNTLEATQDMQRKLSRTILRSHRRVLVFGESTAKMGLKDILDTYTRDPDVRLRTDVFVVKDASAKEFLDVPFPDEYIPAIGALKEHEAMGGLGSTVFVDFLLNASTVGSCPTLPIIQITSKAGKRNGFQYAGRAIFNEDLQMVGSLESTEAQLAFWVKNANKFLTISTDIPQARGNVSLDVIQPKSKITPIIQGKNISFRVELTGSGTIRENNTTLDLSKYPNVQGVESELEQATNERVQSLLTKVQTDYGTDIFGFGEVVHQKHPYQWKTISQHWNTMFRTVKIKVKTHLTIRSVGLTGPSLHLKEREIQKSLL